MATWREISMLVLAMASLAACDGRLPNNPHAAEAGEQKILYSVFTSPPKHLDPIRTYNVDDASFIDQVYEPPLQYAYLQRPYTLEPATLTRMPTVTWLDARGRIIPTGRGEPAFTRYEFELRRGIRYAPHPAFAATRPATFRRFEDFTETGTKELTADDYIYQMKRMADPRLQLPIWDVVSNYIVGMTELRSALVSEIKQRAAAHDTRWLDLDAFPLAGLKKIDDYHFAITLRGKYPQFKYWLAFHFFSPVPREVDRFYHLPGMVEKNITLDTHPVGTGPYMFGKLNVNEQIELVRNPNYHEDYYPTRGEQSDRDQGLLKAAGERLPRIDKAVFTLEREAIPVWSKFLQGYYDRSGISSDSFDRVVNVSPEGISLSDDMKQKGIRLTVTAVPETYYLGFNMRDAVVGGLDEKHRKLRQAIAIAFDQDEQIAIFANGRGETGYSPIAPGVFGYARPTEQANPWITEVVNGRVQKKSLALAKQLLAEAGYPNGIDAVTGKPLVLNLDTTEMGADDHLRFEWYIRQFRKIDITLNIRATDYNRYQDKHEKGNVQIFFYGWLADYPDPENFLFLLYGPNGRVGSGGSGVNSSNYNNPEYNRLFDRVKLMEDTPERLQLIRQMVAIFQHDLPWASLYYPQSFGLSNPWMAPSKPHGMSLALLKYQDIDARLRAQKQREWNQPVYWPLIILAVIFVGLIVVGAQAWRRRAARRVIPGRDGERAA